MFARFAPRRSLTLMKPKLLVVLIALAGLRAVVWYTYNNHRPPGLTGFEIQSKSGSDHPSDGTAPSATPGISTSGGGSEKTASKRTTAGGGPRGGRTGWADG